MDLEQGMYYGGGSKTQANNGSQPLPFDLVSLYLRGRTDGFVLKVGRGQGCRSALLLAFVHKVPLYIQNAAGFGVMTSIALVHQGRRRDEGPARDAVRRAAPGPRDRRHLR